MLKILSEILQSFATPAFVRATHQNMQQKDMPRRVFHLLWSRLKHGKSFDMNVK